MVRRLAHGKVHGLGAQLLFEDGDAGNRAALADQAHGRAPLGLDGFDERAPCRVLQGPEPPVGAVEDAYVDRVGRAHALKVLVDRAHELRLDGMHVLVRHDPHAQDASTARGMTVECTVLLLVTWCTVSDGMHHRAIRRSTLVERDASCASSARCARSSSVTARTSS